MNAVMRSLGRLSAAVLLLGGLAATGYYVWQRNQTPRQTWRVETPFYTTIQKKAVATGAIVPRNEVKIKSQVSGVVEAMFVEPGQYVQAGDLIARIRIVPHPERVAAAEADVQRAVLRVQNARREHDRYHALLEQKAVAPAEYVRFQQELDYALADEKAARERLEIVKSGASSAQAANEVRSTVAGTVLEAVREIGTFIIESNTFNEGTTIAAIADLNQMIFKGKIAESDVGKLKIGMPMEIVVGALEEHRLAATLEYVAPKGTDDRGNVEFEIRAALDPAPGVFLRAGYSANAGIILERRDSVLAIHEGNLIFEGEQTFVEVETAPDVFEKRAVKTGLSDGLRIEIVAGISPHEKIKVLLN
jgi:HlyD family secretion protein